MERVYYIGMDLHKKKMVYCIKTDDGTVVSAGSVASTKAELLRWAKSIDREWIGGMEATMFTGWVYDLLKPLAKELKVAHPEMLKAITSSKKKNDRIDAEKIADLLRCGFLPECHMVSSETRELRRILRYRNLAVREAVKMKNKTAGLLMEVGAEYNKKRLHQKKYFGELMENLEDVPESVKNLLALSRSGLEMFDGIQKQLVRVLLGNKHIAERVRRLTTIRGVGEVVALTWVLEIDDPHRFPSIRKAVSYSGLCSAQNESAGKSKRGPISKKRNKHLQTVLIEAAKLAPRWNPELAEIHARESERGHKNRATLAVARKLVAFMLAVDKRGEDFKPKAVETGGRTAIVIKREDDFKNGAA